MGMTNSAIHCTALAAWLAIALLCCGGCRERSPQQIDESRIRDAGTGETNAVSSADRFGFSPANPPQSGGNEAAGAPRFVWTLPDGWKEQPSTRLRMINLQVGGDANAECYLTILPERGGGRDANINRWRRQMSLPPLSEQALDELHTRPLLGRPAVFVTCEGTYIGMSGEFSRTDYVLAGLVLAHERFSVFVKMIGPAAVVSDEMDRFHAFCASIRIEDHIPPQTASAAAVPPSRYTWSVPPLWQVGPARAMREVTMTVPDSPETECYLTILGGDAGGLEANINRWRGQMGQAAWTPEEIVALPTVDILGAEAQLVEIIGDFTGMSGGARPGFKMLAAVCRIPGSTLFVKMTGPEAIVDREKNRFLAFCASIQSR